MKTFPQIHPGRRVSRLVLLHLVLGVLPAGADYKDDIGFTALQNLLGAETPTGSGVTVSQVESLHDGHYLPISSDTEFGGKTIVDETGSATGTSTHATLVGRYLYGNSSSISPGINTVSAYGSSDWLQDGFLDPQGIRPREPRAETRDVQNHSWISSSYAEATNVLRRLDFAIRRDGFTAVVGLNNGEETSVPWLLPHSYNAISVGRSDGHHSRGGTTFEEPGRTKPDIVAPLTATSYTTPLVGSAAALLIEAARNTPAWAAAEKPEVVKALLMAGATKDEWSTWDRTPSRPLDEVYGAGELNIFNSYVILTNGLQAGGSEEVVASSGWAAGLQSSNAPGRYFIETPPGRVAPELSAVLVWNRHMVDRPGIGFNPQPEMPDMSLSLRKVEGFTPGAVVDLSTSAVDNVEHLYRTDLPPGRYVLEVTTDLDTEYALAWRGETVLHVPVLHALAIDAGGTARITVDGLPDTPYELAYAQAPSPDWVPLATNTPPVSPFALSDPGAGSATHRVYRVRALGVE